MASDEDHTQFLDLATGSSLRHVPQPAPAARLVVMEGSELEGEDELQEIVLEPGQDYVVGRGETCTVPINSRKLSRQHLRLYPGDDQWGVEDLNSTNGIYVNGQRVNDSWLTPGDEVYLGGIQLRYVLEGGAGSEATGGWRDAAPDDDDDNERTMYFGASIGEAQVASSAILEAREAVEEDVTEDLTEQVVPTVQREALPEPGRWSKRFRQAVKIMAFLAILLGLAVSAIAYYPVYAKNSAIEAIVKRLEGPLRSLADNAYRSAGSLSPEVSERQLAQLARLGELVSPHCCAFPTTSVSSTSMRGCVSWSSSVASARPWRAAISMPRTAASSRRSKCRRPGVPTPRPRLPKRPKRATSCLTSWTLPPCAPLSPPPSPPEGR